MRDMLSKALCRLKAIPVNGSHNLQPIIVWMSATLSEIITFIIWSIDKKLAYIQAEKTLQRKKYIGEPAVKFDLLEDMALQYINRLYALSDYGYI